VELMLKRHRRGQEGDYVTAKDADGFSLGESYPSHYYSLVRTLTEID
jgi:hypothetical protein